MRAAVILLFSLAACSVQSDPPRNSELGLALGFPEGFDADVTTVELHVFDELAMCDGQTTVGGSLLQTETLEPGVPATIQVSAGSRVFYALGFELGTEVAEGCERAVLLEGQMLELQIDMVETS